MDHFVTLGGHFVIITAELGIAGGLDGGGAEHVDATQDDCAWLKLNLISGGDEVGNGVGLFGRGGVDGPGGGVL